MDLDFPRPLPSSAGMEPQVSMDPTHSNFCDGVSSVCCGDDMYVYGGHAADRVWRLHMPTATWTEIQTRGQIPLARFHHTSCFFKGYMLMCGGELLAGSKFTPSGNGIMYYELCLETHEWSLIDCFGDIPLARSHHTATVCRDSMILFGGKPADGDVMTNRRLVDLKRHGFHDLFIFHIISRTWRRIEMYDPRVPMLWGHSACMYQDTHLLFFGGFDVSSSELQALDRHGSLVFEDDPPIATISNVTHILNVETTQFQRSTPLPSDVAPAPRALHCAQTFNDELIVFGGMTVDPFGRGILTNDCWIWEIVSGRWVRVDFALPQWQSARMLCCAYYSQLVVASSLSFVFFLDNGRRELGWQRAPCSIQRLLILDTLSNRRSGQRGPGGPLSNINEVFNPRLAVPAAKQAERVRGDKGLQQTFATFPGSAARQGTTWMQSMGNLGDSNDAAATASAKEVNELKAMILALQAEVRAQERRSEQQPAYPPPAPSTSATRHAKDASSLQEAGSSQQPPLQVQSWDFGSTHAEGQPPSRSESQQRSLIIVSKGVRRVAAPSQKVQGSSRGEYPSPPARQPSQDAELDSAAPSIVQQKSASVAKPAVRRSKAAEHSNNNSTSPSERRSTVSVSTAAVAVDSATQNMAAAPTSSTDTPQPARTASRDSQQRAVGTPLGTPRRKEWAAPTAATLSFVPDLEDEEAAELARLAEVGLRLHQQLHQSGESKRQLLKKERQDRIAQLQERLLALETLPLISDDKKEKISYILEETSTLKSIIETGRRGNHVGVAGESSEINSVDVDAGTSHPDMSSQTDAESESLPPEKTPHGAPAAVSAHLTPGGSAGPSSRLEAAIQRRKANATAQSRPVLGSSAEAEIAGRESLREQSRHREWHDAGASVAQSGGPELSVSAPSSSAGGAVARGSAALAIKFDELNSVLQQQRSRR
jgi:hypothetical protein